MRRNNALKVTVLMGGDSPERDVSLVSGQAVVEALRRRGHDVCSVDPALPAEEQTDSCRAVIGELPAGEIPPLPPGRRFDWLRLPRMLEADVAFIGLHGGAGEDGRVQALLETAGIPYTGTGVLGSALAMNKDRAKVLFRDAGVQTAPHLILASDEVRDVRLVRERIETGIGFPVVLKPNCQGSSVGFSYVPEAAGLGAALEQALAYDDRIIVERYIPGREITAALLDGEALPLVEIVPEGGFYDYRRKYTKGSSRYEAPADLPAPVADRIRREAVLAWRALGCRDYARADFRLSDGGEPYCLEVNTLPGMTELSLVPMAAARAGIPFDELVERICMMSLARRRAGAARR
ncbi:MAG: D-alanine--D-alanine ligase [Candidatus Krumholzibacteria bacterium]|nr:D-alanine--D-alanine ligase [Candidatus Krumholzibacteria bacterium]